MAFVIPFVAGALAYGAVAAAGGGLLLAGLAFTAVQLIAGALINKDSGQKIRPDQLKTATATEARPVPVTWGVVRLPGNFLRYDKSQFRSKAIKQRTSAFGSKKTVGYEYYLGYDYGVCTGSVDKITKVWSNPGEEVVWQGEEDFSGGDIQDISLKGADKGGTVTLYRGTMDQVRQPGTVYEDDVSNYRGTFFVHLPGHYIGKSPNPTSYLFEIHRLPVVNDENGDPIDGLFKRGSKNTDHPAYDEANPAAIVFEMFTNKQWGRGLPQSKIDIEAFKRASEYYADQNVGISMSIGSQDNIEGIIDKLQSHTGMIIFTKGDIITCRAMSDPTVSYSPRIALNRSMLENIQMSRPAWAGTPNEIRAAFINRENNYQTEIVVAQDLGSIQMANTINSTEVDINAFSNRNTAETQAYRILSEITYPAAQLTATLTRFHADLEPGAFVELVIDDFNGQDVTTFWRVLEIDDGEQDPAGVRVTLHEDFYATAFIGTSTIFTVPVPSYEFRNQLDNDEVNDADDFSSLADPGEIDAAKIIEPPFSMTRGAETVLMAYDAESNDLIYTDGDWRVDGSTGAYTELWQLENYKAVFGTLDAELPADTRILLRDQVIDITIDDEWQRTALVDAIGKVKIDTDNFANLLETMEATIVIGNEFMQIGDAEETPTGVRILTLARGSFGTPIEAHAASSEIYFFVDLEDGLNLLETAGLPKATDIEVRMDRYSIRGLWGFSANTRVVSYTGKSQQPFPHLERQTEKVGSVWTIEARPRIFVQDLQTEFFQDVFDRKAATNPYGIRVEILNGSTVEVNETLGKTYFTGAAPAVGVDTYEYVGQQDNDVDSGFVRLVVNGMSGRTLKIYTTDDNGNESEALHLT